MTQIPVLLSTASAAARLGLTPERVAALCAAKILPAQKIGREWIIFEHDLIAFQGLTRKPGRPKTQKLKP
jgi:hypothetical protein